MSSNLPKIIPKQGSILNSLRICMCVGEYRLTHVPWIYFSLDLLFWAGYATVYDEDNKFKNLYSSWFKSYSPWRALSKYVNWYIQTWTILGPIIARNSNSHFLHYINLLLWSPSSVHNTKIDRHVAIIAWKDEIILK